MKIAIACDHGGICLKQAVVEVITELGHTYEDFGCFDGMSVDYPEYAIKAATAVTSGDCDLGILMCGTGIGMSIAANKIKGIRCGHVTDAFSAEMTRAHNNANMIALGGRITTPATAKAIVKAWLTASFLGGRHERRVEMLNALDEK